MPLHLVKLCVGVETPDQLRAWQHGRREVAGAALVHTTRMMPRRRDAILEGGSLYWVMKGAIRCRQPILDLEAITDPDSGRSACRIHLDPGILDTEHWPWRPFQGWRYLVAEKAPPDRIAGTAGEGDETGAMPESLRRDLRDLGLL
ncbi:DUF1489 family protein [Roseospira visakhapatnamensis]|uniref:DUF1489 family protein n=1 Tax=Roseospira visakhapatnamensis TaxID=390880 RepID=A0A7W6W8J6_9PROT|nr:DUF1489 domain-containing protein [Roseospira visakhapatnamensis]MBB4264452.1 hypothetical protein [Roseospira visakhapatnamensis]